MTICELAKIYRDEAKKLFDYRKKLLEKLENETDVDARKSLEARIYTIETERYEIIESANEMEAYVRAVEGRKGKI